MFGREHQIVTGLNDAKNSYIDTSLYDYTTGNGFPAMADLNDWDGNAAKPTFNDKKSGSDVVAKQKAAYFTARFNVIDDLHVITGGRYNDWHVEGEAYSKVQDASDKEFIPYLGAVYQITPQLMAYSSYTETFLSQKELDINDDILKPVTGKSKEIGLKSKFFDSQLITSFAYFDIEQVNLAIPDPLTTTPENTKDQHRYINADGINSNGFELELAGELYANLQVRVN